MVFGLKPYLQWFKLLHARLVIEDPRRKLLIKRLALGVLFVFVLLSSVFYTRAGAPTRVYAATSSTLNFQARLLSNSGAIVPDGTYSVQFNLYAGVSGGVTQWTETQNVPVRSGYLSAYLGSSNPFPGTIDWSQEQWLTMNVNGDGEMSPRLKLTAVPYAFRAGQADKLTITGGTVLGDNLAQLAPGALQPVSSSVAGLRINQTGSGGLLQLAAAGLDMFTIDNGGNGNLAGTLTVSGASLDVGTNTQSGLLTLHDGSGGSSGLQANAAGLNITSGGNINLGASDGTGTLFVLDTKNTAGDPVTGVNGGMYYNSIAGKFRCYQNGQWQDCINGANNNSTASFVSGLANVAGTATGTAVETLIFTSATAVSNTAGITGFTAPAAGSFRTCLIKNNAAITGGSLNLRWRVNGVSVGAGACTMNTTKNRQSATALDPGVVTFNAGDTIGLAFDTVGLLPAGTNDYTIFWTVEYNASNAASNNATLQSAYNASSNPELTLDNTRGAFTIRDNAAPITGNLFEIQNDGGLTTYFGVSATGVTSENGITINSGGLNATGTVTLNGATSVSGANTFNVGTGTTTLGGALIASGPTNLNGNTFIGNTSSDRLTLTSQILGASGLVFQGATDNAFTTTFNVIDPTANNIINVPDASGTFAVSASGNVALSAAGAITTINNPSFTTSVTSPSFTGSGAVTLSSGGAGDLTLDSASNKLVIAGTDTSIERTAAGSFSLNFVDAADTTVALGNSGLGNANLNLVDGELQIGGTTVLTNGRVLQNVTLAAGLVTSGTLSNARGGTGLDTSGATNGQLLIGNGSGFALGSLANNGGISITTGAGTLGLAVTYGSAANTAVQGNTTLICPSGSGNLSGTGNTITLGSGGTCNSLTTINNPSFTTSVTSPSFTGSGAVTLSSGGAGDLTLDSASNKLVIAGTDTSIERTAAGSFSLNFVDAADTTLTLGNSGVGNANLNLSDGNLQIGGTVALTNTRVLQNVTLAAGLVTSGTLSNARGGTGLDTSGATNGQLLIGNGTGFSLGGLANNGGVTITTGSGTLGIAVAYGSAANTAVQGNTTLICPSGSGNLSGTGNTITLGTGGTCNGLTTVNNPNFSTSVTSPLFTNSGALTLSTTGVNDLTLTSGSGNLALNATNVNTAASLNYNLNNAANTTFALNNTLAGTASLNIVDGTFQMAGTSVITNGGGIQNITGFAQTSGDFAQGGTGTFTTGSGAVSLKGATTITNTTTNTTSLTVNGTTGATAAAAVNIAQTGNASNLVMTNTAMTTGSLLSLTQNTSAFTGTGLLFNFASGSGTFVSGNFLDFQVNGASRLRIDNNGALITNSTSTTALDINNAAGLSFLNIDTSSTVGLISIGSSTTDAKAILLVLDSYNNATDPTGANGSQYYNSARNVARCYEGIRGWTDCSGISKPNTRRTTVFTASGTGVNLNGLGYGDVITSTATTSSAVAATANNPAAAQVATSGALNNGASFAGNTNYNSSASPSLQTQVVIPTITSVRVWSGLTNQITGVMQASANPAGSYAAFRFDTSAGDTNWMCVTKDGTTQHTPVSSGVAVVAGTSYELEIIDTTTAVQFKVNGNVVCGSFTTQLPPANTLMRVNNSVTALVGAIRQLQTGWIYVDSDR